MAGTEMATLPMCARIQKSPSPYTPAQVIQYLHRLGFEHTFTEDDIINDAFPKNPVTLRKLSRLHLLAFPFETSAMHYQSDHFIDVSPQGVFERLVLNNKGSYCFGMNGLMLGMLRALGFRAYGGAARVNMTTRESDGPPGFGPNYHRIIFVQPCPDDETWTYLVDVGYGGSGLTRPMALVADSKENIVLGATPSERHRLVRRVFPRSSLETSDLDHPETEYQLHVSHACGDEPWRILYTFTTREFYQHDYEASSFHLCMSPIIPYFWRGITAVRHFVLNEAEVEEANAQVTISRSLPHANGLGSRWDGGDETLEYFGRLTMNGKEVKRSIGTKSEIVKILGTDAERIRVLRETFGVDLKDEDVIHIRGREAALDD